MERGEREGGREGREREKERERYDGRICEDESVMNRAGSATHSVDDVLE